MLGLTVLSAALASGCRSSDCRKSDDCDPCATIDGRSPGHTPAGEAAPPEPPRESVPDVPNTVDGPQVDNWGRPIPPWGTGGIVPPLPDRVPAGDREYNPFEDVSIPWDESTGDGRYVPRTPTVEAPRPVSRAADAVAALRGIGGVIDIDDAGHVVAVNLSQANVRDDDLAWLADLPTTRQLDLGGARITNRGLRSLRGLAELQLLAVGDTAVTDDGLADIAALPRLRFLLLDGTKVSDAGVRHLLQLRQLDGLSIRGTRITAGGVERLRQALPACRVVSDGERDDMTSNTRSQFDLAVELARAGNAPEAIEEFESTVGPAAARYNMGLICYQSGDTATSRRYFEAALRIDPDLEQAREWLTWLDAEQPLQTATPATGEIDIR